MKILNPMPQPLYLFLSGSAFIVCLTVPNNELPSLKSVFEFVDHVSNLYEIHILTINTLLQIPVY